VIENPADVEPSPGRLVLVVAAFPRIPYHRARTQPGTQRRGDARRLELAAKEKVDENFLLLNHVE
jgi:hypothetical protein